MFPTQRKIRDHATSVSKAMPAAAAANATDPIYLGKAWPTTEKVPARIIVPALPSLANTKEAVFTLKDSANGSDFDALEGVAPIVLEGATATPGHAGINRLIYLPPGVRSYVRLDAAVEADGGNNTAVSYTLELSY